MNGDTPLTPTSSAELPQFAGTQGPPIPPQSGGPGAGDQYQPPAPKRREPFVSGLVWQDWTLITFLLVILIGVISSWTHLSDRVDTISDQIKSVDESVQKESENVQIITTSIAVQQQEISEMKTDVQGIKINQEPSKKDRK